MRNFVIFLQGDNFQLDVDGETQRAGFFATRRVEAENEEAASDLAIARLLAEPELQGKALPDFVVAVKVVHEMPMGHKNAYTVFEAYPMEEV
jgi:hypothetical protein